MLNDSERPDTPEKDDPRPAEAESIGALGGVIARRGAYRICCLTVIGQIEGHYALPAGTKATRYEHVLPALFAIDGDDRVDGLLILLNTSGGDVEAGLAIAEMIAGMHKPSVSLVLGGSHSIGVPLAVAADRSFIAPSASMTVHPVRTTGLTVGAPQTFRYFEKLQERITRFVSEHSGIGAARYRELVMNTGELVTDIGTVLGGKEAVECGLIGAVGTLSDASDALSELIREKRDPSCHPE